MTTTRPGAATPCGGFAGRAPRVGPRPPPSSRDRDATKSIGTTLTNAERSPQRIAKRICTKARCCARKHRPRKPASSTSAPNAPHFISNTATACIGPPSMTPRTKRRKTSSAKATPIYPTKKYATKH
ncbi:hypothetical protein [Lysobacter gummosus]|uniref:hypothetical protein n=1 Tax=Lysobacter gummosus TaxID=262324 RepID=UPI00363798E7